MAFARARDVKRLICIMPRQRYRRLRRHNNLTINEDSVALEFDGLATRVAQIPVR